MAPSALYALLVGIDQYDPKSGVRSLRGCVNDVNAMEQLLNERFGVPSANIRKLTNKTAKYQAVKDAFRQHLIANARKWQEAGSPGEPPAFLFHYSGHGSQARDETGTEPDGLDETLVTYNSRTPGVYDLKDWELGQLIEELNRYSQNVTIILDCCHSGSGTRDASDNVAQTRRCPPDLRPQPRRRPMALRTAQTRSVSGAN
ncbi:MAG TPA: caspase family protein, partial [Caldilineaceae bacterium]|nr:caspase family protein [Caldilineaceae bacterium]